MSLITNNSPMNQRVFTESAWRRLMLLQYWSFHFYCNGFWEDEAKSSSVWLYGIPCECRLISQSVMKDKNDSQ